MVANANDIAVHINNSCREDNSPKICRGPGRVFQNHTVRILFFSIEDRPAAHTLDNVIDETAVCGPPTILFAPRAKVSPAPQSRRVGSAVSLNENAIYTVRL